MIDSKADADKNKLSTDTLTYSNIKNEAEWSAETKGANYQKGDGVANKDKGLTPDFAGSKGEDDSITKSAIALGEIEIRSDEGKADKDKTDLTDLSRDPDKANNPLDKIFDKDAILEKQQAAALFGEIGFDLVGKIINKNEWKDDDPRSIALHGLIGGIMAEINGGEFGEGMTTAAINKLLIAKLGELREPFVDEDGNTILGPDGKPIMKLVFDGDELRWISVGLGSSINGNQGAGIADSATENNYNAYGQRYKIRVGLDENKSVEVSLVVGQSSEDDGSNDKSSMTLEIGLEAEIGYDGTKAYQKLNFWNVLDIISSVIDLKGKIPIENIIDESPGVPVSEYRKQNIESSINFGGTLLGANGTIGYTANGSFYIKSDIKLTTYIGGNGQLRLSVEWDTNKYSEQDIKKLINEAGK